MKTINSITQNSAAQTITVNWQDGTSTTYTSADEAQYLADTGRTADFAALAGAGQTSLADRQASAIAKTYADVDDVYALAIGNRAEEYKQAETDARAYAAAGYTGTPTAYVSGWAAAKGLTNQHSADAIIARADALTAAKLSLRNQRFTSQAAMTTATAHAELDTAIAAWDSYVAVTKVALA